MSSVQYTLTAYGLSQSLINVFPQPIVSPSSNPTTSNKAQIGTLWINKSANTAYVLTSIVNNVANWQLIESSGGAGVFSSLTVNPGPITLGTTGNAAINIGNPAGSGTFNINAPSGASLNINGNGGTINIGNDSPNANTITIGNVSSGTALFLEGGDSGGVNVSTSAAGTINIGNSIMTGAITIGASTAGQIINIANVNAGGAQTINIASGNNSANNSVNILNGVMTGGAPTLNIMASGGEAGFVNIANGAVANSVIIGSTTGAAVTTIKGGTGGITLNAPFTALPGPVYLYTGAGVPSNGLALHIGDMYINTTAATAGTRLYIATGVGAWTFFTANA